MAFKNTLARSASMRVLGAALSLLLASASLTSSFAQEGRSSERLREQPTVQIDPGAAAALQARPQRDPHLRPVNPFAGVSFEYARTVPGVLPPAPAYVSPAARIPLAASGQAGVSRDPLNIDAARRWNPGDVITVKFLGGTPFVRNKVRAFAEQWSQHANIRFQFVEDNAPAIVRVGFVPDGTSWSLVGRDALLVPFDIATMNLGAVNDETTDIEFSRVVLHEFGHALGLGHEHQSPISQIQWDVDKVYAFFASRTPPWDRATVDSQVLSRNSINSTLYSQYDPLSIMHYGYPAELTLDGVAGQRNPVLSATDIAMIRQWYPFPADAAGTIATGDDCDAVDFRVEFNVLPPDKVGFTIANTRAAFWWKGIEIPIGGGANRHLMIQSEANASGAAINPAAQRTLVLDVSSLDQTRRLRFWKAKFLGVHTLLPYNNWDVLPVLPGGSRVNFTWTRDHCG